MSSARGSGPFAPPALPGFLATTSPSAPSLRIGTQLLMGEPLGALPWHRCEGSHVPYTSPRWTHAASMPVTARAVSRRSPELRPSLHRNPGFDDTLAFSTRRQRFTCVRLPSTHLTDFFSAFSDLVHHPGHWTRAAVGSLDPEPTLRVRGASPHLAYSRLQ